MSHLPTSSPNRSRLLQSVALTGVAVILFGVVWEGFGARAYWNRPWFWSAVTANDSSVQKLRELNQTLKSPELETLATQFEAVVKENAQFRVTAERVRKFLSAQSEADSIRTELEKIPPVSK